MSLDTLRSTAGHARVTKTDETAPHESSASRRVVRSKLHQAQLITVRAQAEGVIMFGTTAALHGEITLKNGRVEQTNFADYQILRFNEAPVVEVHIVKSAEPPGGMGEPGTAAVAPAITNAIYAATGKRIRRLPVAQRAAHTA
jgi:CO/xanthine dehydrogenase Mo-binding subunit